MELAENLMLPELKRAPPSKIIEAAKKQKIPTQYKKMKRLKWELIFLKTEDPRVLYLLYLLHLDMLSQNDWIDEQILLSETLSGGVHSDPVERFREAEVLRVIGKVGKLTKRRLQVIRILWKITGPN